jgi:phage/plasmid-like protein (TIGR03299 family)
MAHRVETMFSVSETPWHGLGQVITDAPTVDEGIKAAGLDWEVQTEPVFVADGRECPARAVVRATDKSILGVVGPKWRPLQNREAFDWFQPIIDSGLARLTTAGSLCEGRRVWVMAEIGDPLEIVKGDEVRRFVLLSNSHDGSSAVRVGFTPVRVVCANTLAMAEGDNCGSQLLRLRHTKRLTDVMAQVRDIMNLANSTFEATAEQYRRLAAAKVNRDDLRKYVKEVLLLSEDKKKPGELHPKSAEIMAAVLETFDSGKGQENRKVKGTWWAAYNAVTEYLSYTRGKTTDSRLDSLWFGEGFKINEDALDLALQMAA